MDKSATFSEVCKKASDLFGAGMYRKALSKFETALTAAQGEEVIVDVHFWIIQCRAYLKEVSGAALAGLGRRLTFFVLSASGGFTLL